MGRFSLAEETRIVEAIAPCTGAAAAAGDYINMRYTPRVAIVVHIAQGNAATVALTIEQAKAAAGTGSKPITEVVPIWANEDCAADDKLPLIYQRVGARERRERVRESLEKVELYERRRHYPNQLSGGQQQRVAIARAMASHPSIFLADEPTGNLDQKTGRQIMDLFHELHRQGSTIVLITHDEGVAAQAERSIRIMDGHVEEVRAE